VKKLKVEWEAAYSGIKAFPSAKRRHFLYIQ